MNSNQNQNFNYVMPEDDEEDYEDADGEEMVDMEDEEIQPENDGLIANKVEQAQIEDERNHQNENNQPMAVNDLLQKGEPTPYQASIAPQPGPQQFQAKQIQNQIGRMRPQSAKTMSTQVDQQAFLQQQQQMQFNLMNQQQQQWVQPQQQLGGPPLPSQFDFHQQPPVVNAGHVFYPQQQQLLMVPPKSQKRRPGTAGRKAQMNFGKKSQGPAGGGAFMMGQIPATTKASSLIDLEVTKLRPRVIHQERERLYDDVMKQRMTTNNLKDENTRLKTRLHMVEVELLRKDKVIDDLIAQQEQNFGLPQAKFTGNRMSGVKGDTHLVINLKRKIKDLQVQNQRSQDEVESLRRNIKNTRQQEIEVEMKLYMDECARLRHQLEEVIRSKDTFADPQELKIIEEKFQQREAVINQMQGQNQEISMALQKKEEENRQLAELVQDMERRMKKAQASSKTNLRFKKDVRDKEKEASKMRKDLIELKSENDGLKNLCKDLKERKSQVRTSGPPARLYSAKQGQDNEKTRQMEIQVRMLSQENQDLQKKMGETDRRINQLSREMNKREEELAMATQDKVRFKELSEGYMQEVARLEAQLEAADMKPKSKLSQRPKDTVMRDQSHSLSNIHAQRVKSVEPKQLNQVVTLLRLLLQREQLEPLEMERLVFKDAFDEQAELSIVELKQKFEELGVQSKKSTQLARYLIENSGSGEIIYNENLKGQASDIVVKLKDLIGQYHLYRSEGSAFDSNPAFVQEEYMKKLVVENFGRYRETLVEALRCEDYDEEGLLELAQLQEAISTVNEELESSVLDFMLYYVLVRSEGPEKMQYKVLVELLDHLIQSQSRVASAQRKNRPESSSPEKLKMRNPQKTGNSSGKQKPPHADKEDDEDNYSDEEIANDPDEDEDGTNKLDLIKKRAGDNDSEDEYGNDPDQFEESPRPKVGSQGGMSDPRSGEEKEDGTPVEGGMDMEDDEDIDEDEVIEVAEQIFVRMAEQIIKQERRSIRDVFEGLIFEAEIDGQALELLSPMGLLEGIKALDIDDLTEKEIGYLMRVLTKPELEGSIVLHEFLQIMENLGLYDDDGQGSQGGDMSKGQGQTQMDTEQPTEESPPQKKKKKGQQLDLSKLDKKSVKIMVTLMVHLLQTDMTTQDFFEEVIFEQNVKTKSKQFVLHLLNSDDFFKVLQQKGIRSKATEHPNLREFLQLNAENPNLIVVKNIRKALEQMAENEAFMEAIEKDVLMEEEQEQEREDSDQMDAMINRNEQQDLRGGQADSEDEEQDYERDQDEMSDRNADTANNQALAGLRDINDLDGKSDKDEDDDEDYEKEDYDF